MRAYFANNSTGAFLAEAMAELFGSRRRIAILTLIALLTGLIGPFGTGTDFLTLERYAYWALIVFGTVVPVQLVFTAFERRVGRAHWREWVWVPIASTVSAFPVTAVVVTIALLFGSPFDVAGAASLYVQCAFVIVAVAGVIHLLQGHAAVSIDSDRQPAILRRLPGARRGRLIRLTARDHYVEIVTDRGTALVPMRLRDAIAEVAPTEGTQVHRSHWVATHAVTAQRNAGGAARLHLTDGSVVPVGRTFRQQARDAGVLC